MSNTFWAVYFGATLGTLTVHFTVAVLDEYRAKQRRRNLNLMLEELEDWEADDEDD